MGVVEEAVGHDGREQGEKAIAEEDVAEEGDGVAKETVRTPGFIGERESGSPLRVVVHCLSHKIPGPRSKRTATLANIICQHQFQRNMDPGKDKIKVIGLQDIDGKKVRFLLESGILPATATLDDLPILAFKWTGEELVSRDVDDRVRRYLRNLPFKHTAPAQTIKASRSKTMTEIRESMTDEDWDKYMGQVLLRRLQYEKVAGHLVKSWALEHPELSYDVIQHYTAQKRYNKLDLTPSEQEWVDAPKERGQTSSLLLIQMVLDQMGPHKADGQGPGSNTTAAEERHAREFLSH